MYALWILFRTLFGVACLAISRMGVRLNANATESYTKRGHDGEQVTQGIKRATGVS